MAKEISYLLGYNELSAFTRTFKRWTGQTPAAYHRNFIDCEIKPGTSTQKKVPKGTF
ncbi:helix-turn-helix domain-containing protein [Dyadobacter linearis]|uniref:helix-turn-helix domain-containing protein n=1 Tax=Dyadobacter linearis TaxID=2823330 RepID=UPI001BFCD2BC